MVEVGPQFSPQTWDALKKLDTDKRAGVSLKEIKALDKDGKAGLSDDELLAAGIDQKDIPALRQELARKAKHDPQSVVFNLPEPASEASSGIQQPTSALAQMFGGAKPAKPTNSSSPAQPATSAPPAGSTTHSGDSAELKKLLDGLSANQIKFPGSETTSAGPAAVPPTGVDQEKFNSGFADVGLQYIESHAPGVKLTDAEKASLKEVLAAYNKLPSPSLQAKGFDMLDSLSKLAETKRLTPELLGTVKTLLDPAKTPLHAQLTGERKALVGSALGEIADPSQIYQGHKNTCAGTTSQILLAVRNPNEYLKLVADLASPSGKVSPDTLPGKPENLHRLDSVLQDDKSDRSLSSRLIQPAFMDYADDSKGDFLSWLRGSSYDNAKDNHGGILPAKWSSGLLMSEMSHLLGGLYGKESYQPVLVKQPNAAAQAYAVFGKGDPLSVDDSLALLNKRLGEGKPVPVGIRWSVNDELNFHALLVTRVDPKENLVYFLNPHGKAQTMDLKDFQSRLTAFADPADAAKAPPLPGSGDALNRLTPPLNNPKNYDAIQWDSYRKLSEQLEQDPDLVRVLSDSQRDQLQSRFEDLKLEKSMLNQVMDVVKHGGFNQNLLDRLSTCQDAQEARKLLALASNLADSPLDRTARQELIGSYPERNLEPEQFSTLIGALHDLQFSSDPNNPVSSSRTALRAMTDLAQQKLMNQAKPGAATLDAKQILAKFAELRKIGTDSAYARIAELGGVADAATKAQMIKSMFEGFTPERAEKTIGLLIGNATPAQQHEILSKLDLQRLGNETENIDRAADMLNTISQAGFDPKTLESHLLRFFDGVNSQFSLFNGKDDDLAGAFVRRLDGPALQGLPENVKTRFFKALDSGNTTDQEYAWMRKIAQSSNPETKAGMIRYLMDQNDTNSSQESLIHQMILDTPAEPGPKGEPSALVSLADRLDGRQLADELENDTQAADVGAAIAKAYALAGQKPVKGQLDGFLTTLAKQHREQAINRFIDSPTLQANGRALYKGLAPETLKSMMSRLMDGHTSGALEKTIVKILANTDYPQYGRILGGDRAFMERLSDELDSDQMKRIGDWNKQYAQWLQSRQ